MSAPTSTTTGSAVGAMTEAPADDAAVHLRRLRWAVRATLTLGVAASVAANVLHARPNPISQIIAAWPPLALLLTVELISRVPHHRRSLGTIRIVATSVIAAIATWVSYWHLVGVAARYGETEAGAAYLLPISVDGLVIVASVSLVEITARLRAGHADQRFDPLEAATPSSTPPELPAPQPAAADGRDTGETRGPSAAARHTSVPAGAVPLPRTPARHPRPDTINGERLPRDRRAAHGESHAGTAQTPNALSAEPVKSDDRMDTDEVVPSETAAAVAYWYRREPGLHPADIAARIGRSERTVRRYWPPPPATSPPVNGDRGHDLANSLRA